MISEPKPPRIWGPEGRTMQRECHRKKEKETEHLLSNLREFQVINWHNGFLCFASCLHKFVSWQAFHRWRPVLAFMDMDVDSLLALLSPYRMSGWFPLLAWQRLPCQVLFIFPSLFSILVRKAIWPRRRSTVRRAQGLGSHSSAVTCKIMCRLQPVPPLSGPKLWTAPMDLSRENSIKAKLFLSRVSTDEGRGIDYFSTIVTSARLLFTLQKCLRTDFQSNMKKQNCSLEISKRTSG